MVERGLTKEDQANMGIGPCCTFPSARIITTCCYALPSFLATIILIFPIGGGEGGLRYEERGGGYAQSSS
jgi:hypothetical protein